MTTQRIKNLEELHMLGGATISSNWTNGSGRYVTKRAIPPFCGKIAIGSIDKYGLRGEVLKQIKRLCKKHPRAQYVVYIANLRKARALLRLHGITPTTYAARTKAQKAQPAPSGNLINKCV